MSLCLGAFDSARDALALEFFSEHFNVGLVDDCAVDGVFDSFLPHDLDVVRTDDHADGAAGFEGVVVLDLELVSGICVHIHFIVDPLESAGLDPYVGFMHTDRPGRRSLALDLVEEFRSVLCDRFVLTLINKRLVSSGDFMKREDGAVLLTEDGRKSFFSAWQKRLNEELKHPFIEEKVEWGMLPYVQAMLLARYIRGDLDCYPPFMWK